MPAHFYKSPGRWVMNLARKNKKAIASSVQDFQAGDYEYIEAIRLFIAEEQRHARDLAHFLQINEIPLVKTTFTDGVFRRLRQILGNLEISIAVLITAEIIAIVYYTALRDATNSQVLQTLCKQILKMIATAPPLGQALHFVDNPCRVTALRPTEEKPAPHLNIPTEEAGKS